MICTFFGHSNTPSMVMESLEKAIVSLIKEGVCRFYVGDKGSFDYMARRALERLRGEYPHINYWVVLAYLPGEKCEFDYRDYEKTIYPEGLEKVPKRFAIAARNRWMIEQADFVISYVESVVGGAAKFTEMAKRKGKKIINLAEKE